MKRISLFLLLLTVTLGGYAFSFDWGLQGGVNFTKVNFRKEWRTAFDSNNRVGFFVGPKIQLGLFSGVGVNMAVEYTMYNYNAVKESTNEKTTDKVHALSIPLNLRYSYGFKKVGVFTETGPQLDFNMQGKKWDDFTHGRVFNRDNLTLTWNVGAGIRVSHVEIGLNYYMGFNNVRHRVLESIGSEIIETNADLRANSMQAHVAYYF